MATYTEMQGIFADATLLAKVSSACIVAADTIRQEATNTANHSARLAWAKLALDSPSAVAAKMLPAVIAQNKSLTLAQINSASDANLQTAVDAAVNLFAMPA